MSAPKLIIEESRKIREEMAKENKGSKRWEELNRQLKDLYKQQASQ